MLINIIKNKEKLAKSCVNNEIHFINSNKLIKIKYYRTLYVSIH